MFDRFGRALEAAWLMADAERPRIVGAPGATVIASTLKTPEAERPQFETLDGVARWLRGPARREVSLARVIDEFSWRLTAAGIGLLRVGVNTSTLHPQFLGATYYGGRTRARPRKSWSGTRSLDLVPYANNPVQQARSEGKTIRRRLERRRRRIRLFRAGRPQGARRHGLSDLSGREPVRLRGACDVLCLRRGRRLPRRPRSTF